VAAKYGMIRTKMWREGGERLRQPTDTRRRLWKRERETERGADESIERGEKYSNQKNGMKE